MDEAEFKARGSSFGSAAREYAEHRPSYPDAAIAWILEPVRLRDPLRVLDLGAGTGRITEALQRAEVDVIAVEPDPEMRAVMLERVFGVAALAGTAEDIPLPDERVDAVVVGQAFHWFDADQAHPEIARVLKPGGVFAGLWNGEDLETPWVHGYAAVAGYLPSPEETEEPPHPQLGAHPAFVSVERRSFPNTHRRTADTLVRTLATHSSMLTLPEAERTARLDEVRRYLASRPETADGEFDMPLVTEVLRAIRR